MSERTARGELGGLENVKRLHDYIGSLRKEGRGLPQRAGGPNLSAIANACGFDRGVFYSNGAAKLALDEAWEELGLDEGRADIETAYQAARIKDEDKEPRDRRTKGLEEELLLLRAEVAQLRAENARFRSLQQLMAETGRMP